MKRAGRFLKIGESLESGEVAVVITADPETAAELADRLGAQRGHTAVSSGARFIHMGRTGKSRVYFWRDSCVQRGIAL